MDVYKYQIWTGHIPGSKPIDPCKRGTVNPTNTDQDCNCPQFIMATTPDGNYGMISTNFTGLFDPDRISGYTIDNSTNPQTVTYLEPTSPLGGYQFGDVVLMDHDALTPYNPRAGCLNEQGPHCFIYFQPDYGPEANNFNQTPTGPAPWKSPIYPMDDPTYEPGVGCTNCPFAGVAVGGGSYQGGPWICCDSEEIVDIIAQSGPDRQIPIILDQDYNDIGFYTPFDGGIFQKDLFSNFVTVVENGTTDTINLTNSTPFGLYAFTQGFSFTVDWGDGNIQQVSYPTISLTHQYQNQGNYNISIQMVAPWGITSMSQPITIPYYSGASLTIPNPNLTFTYNSPAGGPVTQNWMYSTFGPLDSGTNVFQYVSQNYAPVPITITGITDSQLTNFSTYSTQPSNSAFLPNGYFLNQLVPLGGEIQVGIGDFQTTLFGEIISASANFTAYTISDGGSMNNPVQMFDYDNGITIFEVDTIGLNQYNLFTQSCDPLSLDDLDEDPEVCDFCLDTQTAFFYSSSYQINVINNRGMWDPGTGYQPGDLVRWAGCCWFAGVTVPPPLAIPPNNPQVFEGGSDPATPIGWWPCPGQNCEATTAYDPAEIYGCTDSTALNYDPLATIDDGSCVYDNITIPGGWSADPTVNTDDPWTGTTTDTGSTSISTTEECCDASALNYAGGSICSQSTTINNTSLCNYPGGGNGDIWVCDPTNILKLRCEGTVSPTSGPAALEWPNTMSYTLVFPNNSTNCSNTVKTPDAGEISVVQYGGILALFGISLPAADPTDSWGLQVSPNSAGGRGTGCVNVSRAWHPPNNNNTVDYDGNISGFGTGLLSGLDNGTSGYGCAYPAYCYSWELATYLTGLQATSPYPSTYQLFSDGPADVPGITGRDMNGAAVQYSDNKVNPVVELIDAYNTMGIQSTFSSFVECMTVMNGCPSEVDNFNY